jgi:hypothetical protein
LEDDVWREEMKRQHPDNPELFWCPKCKTYKARGEFNKRKRNKDGVYELCRECHRKENNKIYATGYKKRWDDEHRDELRSKGRVRYQKQQKKMIKRSVAWQKNNPDTMHKIWNMAGKKKIENITDSYVVRCMRHTGIVDITPETIELKREQIMMHRELRQIKKEVYNGTTGKGNTGTQEPEKGLPDKED